MSPATTTNQQTSQSPEVSTKLPVLSVPSTFSFAASKAPEKDDVATNEPDSLDLHGHDIDSKWKIAFGVCLAIIVILLAGRFLHYTIISFPLDIPFPCRGINFMFVGIKRMH